MVVPSAIGEVGAAAIVTSHPAQGREQASEIRTIAGKRLAFPEAFESSSKCGPEIDRRFAESVRSWLCPPIRHQLVFPRLTNRVFTPDEDQFGYPPKLLTPVQCTGLDAQKLRF